MGGRACEKHFEPRMTRIYTDIAEEQGCAWSSQAALRFQIPSQASLRGIVKSHSTLTPRVCLLRRRFALGKWEVLGGISLLIQRSFRVASRKLACRWAIKNYPPFAPRMTSALPESMLHPCPSVKSVVLILSPSILDAFASGMRSIFHRARLSTHSCPLQFALCFLPHAICLLPPNENE